MTKIKLNFLCMNFINDFLLKIVKILSRTIKKVSRNKFDLTSWLAEYP